LRLHIDLPAARNFADDEGQQIWKGPIAGPPTDGAARHAERLVVGSRGGDGRAARPGPRWLATIKEHPDRNRAEGDTDCTDSDRQELGRVR